jgi:hypothetical protein
LRWSKNKSIAHKKSRATHSEQRGFLFVYDHELDRGFSFFAAVFSVIIFVFIAVILVTIFVAMLVVMVFVVIVAALFALRFAAIFVALCCFYQAAAWRALRHAAGAQLNTLDAANIASLRLTTTRAERHIGALLDFAAAWRAFVQAAQCTSLCAFGAACFGTF